MCLTGVFNRVAVLFAQHEASEINDFNGSTQLLSNCSSVLIYGLIRILYESLLGQAAFLIAVSYTHLPNRAQ